MAGPFEALLDRGQVPRQLELHDHHIDQRRYRRAPSLQHKMGRFTVQGVPYRKQVTHTCQRVCNLQKGAAHVMAQTTEQFFWCGLEVHHVATAVKMFPVRWTQNCTATGRDHGGGTLRQLIKNSLLNVAKLGLTLPVEKLPDRASQSGLNGVVRINERKAKPARKLPSYRGFTRAGQADQTDTQRQDTTTQPTPALACNGLI